MRLRQDRRRQLLLLTMKRLLLIVASAAALTSCGGDDNRSPVAPTSAVDTKVLPSGDAATSLQVTGNTNLTSVGETSQLTATAGFFSGSSRDVSSETIWHSSNPAVATISARGLLTAVMPGRTLINASFQTKASNREVLMLPSGSFILRGRINEPGNLPISNARFEVVEGPPAGQFTMTNYNGAYELYGLSGDVRVIVTKERYVAQTRSVSMTQDRVLDFEILPVVPPIAISGNYRLTFTASERCAKQLVDEARTRTYRALINQNQASVEVLLSDAKFALDPYDGSPWNSFQGRIEANSVTFFTPFYVEVVEQLSATTYLAIAGVGTATATLPTMSGGFNGALSLWEAPNGYYATERKQVASCYASDHQFTFMRE